MANTYSQITIQVVFSVKHRENLILPNWRDELCKYIAGTVNSVGKSLAVGGWMDHIHVLAAIPVNMSISDFVRKIKSNSSRWINEKGFVKGLFRWQEGFGAFTYHLSQRDVLIKYIMNQELHHKKQSFKDEYYKLLEDFDVKFDEKYLFEFY